MKNSNDTIGNRTRDLPVCSAVPKPTALPRAPYFLQYYDLHVGPSQAEPTKTQLQIFSNLLHLSLKSLN